MTNKLVLSVGAAAAMCFAGAANAQVSWTNSLSGTWMDISTTGTALNLSDDGEVNITSTAGNSVFAAGTVRVGSNGAVRFAGSGLSLGFTNQTIPSSAMFSGDQSLAPFWDDINTSSGTNGNIYWENVGGTLVVQWERAGFFGSQDTVTFQLQVHSSGASLAQFLYRDVASARANTGGSATIGYQDGGVGFGDAQFSFNTAGAVSNGLVLSLVPAPGAAVLLGLGGLVATRRRRG